MSSKYTEAFDSLKSNDETKRERTERILAAQSAATQEKTARTGTLIAAKTRRRFFCGQTRSGAAYDNSRICCRYCGIRTFGNKHIQQKRTA